jgi:ABC-type transport system involved in multi-copper enzyme maturation permease subunit
VIAKNTYREIIRDRVLYGIVLMAVLVTSISFFLSTISLGQDARVLENSGLNIIHLLTTLILVFVATQSIARDFEKRALYFLFSKPTTRSQYVLGKYIGLVLLLLTTLLLLGGLYSIGILALHRELFGAGLISFAYSFLEISFLTALAIMFACFTSSLNAILYTLALFIIGHSLGTLKEYAVENNGPFMQKITTLCYYLLPNLEKFNQRPALLYNIPIPAADVFWSIIYWLLYSTLALWLGILIMKQREV